MIAISSGITEHNKKIMQTMDWMQEDVAGVTVTTSHPTSTVGVEDEITG